MLVVPNEFPTQELPYRLALIGEAPGADEEVQGKPFVGATGRLLNALLPQCDIRRSACFVGNISQVRPPGNKIEALRYDGEEIQAGLKQLKADIDFVKPNAIFLMGRLSVLAAGIPIQIEKKSDDDTAFTISSYRGSIFKCRDLASPFYGYKCIAGLHPAYVMRNYDTIPLFTFDLQRARREADFGDLRLTQRHFDLDLTTSDLCRRLDAISESDLVSIDIEGGIATGVRCVGISLSATTGFIITFHDRGLDEQARLFRALARVLSSPSIPKVLQNSLYDNFVLSWLFKMPIRNVVHDTMLSGWEIYPELPKGLGTQTSIWTDQPYYKNERKSIDPRTLHAYCCTDSSVTWEIANKHRQYLDNPAFHPVNIKTGKTHAREHFDFNMSLLPIFHYMELKGIRYNSQLAKEKLDIVTVEMAELKSRFDQFARCDLNPNSPKQMCDVLYSKLGYEPQYTKEHGRKTDKRTANKEALLNLLKDDSTSFTYWLLKWKALEGQRKQLEISPDADSRVRCGFNIVGTETGRFTSYESPTGTGSNLQTITKVLRDIYTADEGKIMFKVDLAGADGWTVATHCKRLGDSRMWEDYCTGIKPARVIAAMYQKGRQISQLPPAELKAFLKTCDIPEWLYFSSKRVQHGSNYKLGKLKMSGVILMDSWKESGEPVWITPKDCELLQNLYMSRYIGVEWWHQWAERELRDTKKLLAASGHTRHFFGRPNDHETLRAFLAHEPQANTTYALSMAFRRLWLDPENRDGDKLIIEPLLQVHDEMVGQFPEDKLDWALAKIKSYMQNDLTIAGTDLQIPFEGFYGPHWNMHDAGCGSFQKKKCTCTIEHRSI